MVAASQAVCLDGAHQRAPHLRHQRHSEGVTKLLFNDSPEAHGHSKILGGACVLYGCAAGAEVVGNGFRWHCISPI